MMYRYPPFYDPNTYEVYRKISIGYYEFSSKIPLNARKLIVGLLQPDLSRRLGCLSVRNQEIKKLIF